MNVSSLEGDVSLWFMQGLPVIYFGLFLAVLVFLRLPGSVIAYAMKNRFSYRFLLSGVVLVFAAGFLKHHVCVKVFGV